MQLVFLSIVATLGAVQFHISLPFPHSVCLWCMVSMEAQYLRLSVGDIDFVETDIRSHSVVDVFVPNYFMVLRYRGVV
jgi:hypothetical protein